MFWGGGNFSCRHPKLWSYIKSNVKAFFITGAIVFTISASATVVLHSKQVRYKNDKSVEQAINELYEKASRCPKKYTFGDIIMVNNEQYYVIEDSPRNQDYVIALKVLSLSTDEVNSYGANHINQYSETSIGTALDNNGYGAISYYTSSNCGYVDGQYKWNCSVHYNSSDVKYVVDNWASNHFQSGQLKQIEQLYARILTTSDLLDTFGYVTQGSQYMKTDNTPNWFWVEKSTPYWIANAYRAVNLSNVYTGGKDFRYMHTIRPVINVYKSAITKANNN